MTYVFDEERACWYDALACKPEGRAEGEFVISDVKVSCEEFVGVKNAVIISDNNSVPFKGSVGLMARQKELKGCVRELDGVVFSDFSRVTKFRVVWVCHFTQME